MKIEEKNYKKKEILDLTHRSLRKFPKKKIYEFIKNKKNLKLHENLIKAFNFSNNKIVKFSTKANITPKENEENQRLNIVVNQLQKLDLSFNYLTMIEITEFNNLQILSLSNNLIFNTPNFFNNLKLISLDLSFNKLKVAGSFDNLKNLKYLFLQNNLLNVIPFLPQSIALFDFSSNKCKNFKEIKKLENCRKISDFRIANNPFIQDFLYRK